MKKLLRESVFVVRYVGEDGTLDAQLDFVQEYTDRDSSPRHREARAVNTPQVYRIERRGAGVLHLYRDDVLVDIDRETDRDSRSDIERWGSAVAWAEDNTVIERWDQAEQGEDWQTLTGIPYRRADR